MHVAADRPEVHPQGPASQTYTGGRSEVQPPDPTGQTATVVKNGPRLLVPMLMNSSPVFLC